MFRIQCDNALMTRAIQNLRGITPCTAEVSAANHPPRNSNAGHTKRGEATAGVQAQATKLSVAAGDSNLLVEMPGGEHLADQSYEAN